MVDNIAQQRIIGKQNAEIIILKDRIATLESARRDLRDKLRSMNNQHNNLLNELMSKVDRGE